MVNTIFCNLANITVSTQCCNYYKGFLAVNKNSNVTILGLMSGTSLDGLDMALCQFRKTPSGMRYKLLKASTVTYPKRLQQQLLGAMKFSASDYFTFDAHYAGFVAQQVKAFVKKTGITPAAIASHGHTVFHQPHKGFTTQIGNGAILAAKTGITTVCDFRSLDVGLGGQGAPLVPIGDALLFGTYAACLNIGGIANISFNKRGKRVAYDVCLANILLNYLAAGLKKPYDKDGALAAKGRVDAALLKQLDALAYYKVKGAKSIGRELFEKSVRAILDGSGISYRDQLATATAHIAQVIARELNKQKLKNVLVTGGGAHNTYLIKCIRQHTACQVIVPEKEVVNFKEALIFAFLGYLRLNGQMNTLASVTGATKDSIGGAVYYVG